jgi:DNA-binding response OmpR family regulator
MNNVKKNLILLVDDTVEIRDVLNLHLSSQGFEVIEACNGREGIQMAEKFNPDIVVSDFIMPQMNGIDAAAILKWKAHTQHIPIIILSSFPFGKNMILQMKDIGIDAYMMKPYEFDELLSTISDLLGQKPSDSNKIEASQEKRKFKRFQPLTAAEVEIGGASFITSLQNVSREGMSILLPKHEPVGTVLTISINADAKEKDPSQKEGVEKILGTAKIMWIQPERESQFLAGVEILSLGV